MSPALPVDAQSAGKNLVERVRNGWEALTLDVIDFLAGTADDDEQATLDTLLREGGSVWRVGETTEGRRGLVRRVADSLQATADQAMSGGKQHHKHLRKAWGAAYGRNPSPGEAYKDAVCAVEAVSIPVVQPSKKPETLGLVIRELIDNPSKFDTRLRPSPPTSPSAPPLEGVGVVRDMMQLLWKSQWDRHGVQASVPLTVSQDEAEDALSLAVTLVRWFETGAIYRK